MVPIRCGDVELEEVEEFKYLGVTFSGSGSWHEHATNVINEARSQTASMGRILRNRLLSADTLTDRQIDK